MTTRPATAPAPLLATPRARATRTWSTATGRDASDTLPGDLDALGRHVGHGARGRMFSLGLLTDSVRGFLAPRLVTVLVATAVLGVVVSLAV